VANSFLKVGKGPIHVLALHGWFGCARAWGAFVDAIDTSRFTYVFMDYRGYGASIHALGNYTIAEIAADTVALADELRWDRFHLLGHSMGGSAIQYVLADAPTRVQSLVAVTPVPASGVPFDDATWELFVGAAGSDDARRGIINHSTGGRLSPAWIAAMARRSQEHSSRDAFAAYLHAWARTNFVQRIEGNTVPVKVIVGANDPGLNSEVMRQTYMRWYPNAELDVMENAGHYPMDETPVSLATNVEEFIARAGKT
jgi:pimeloyl-ACP methyl ester carboxylesterase